MYVALFIQGQGAFPGKKMQEKVITEKAYMIVFYLYISQWSAHLQYVSSTQNEEKKKKIYTHIIIRCYCTIMDVHVLVVGCV